jgi:hypothetical protein
MLGLCILLLSLIPRVYMRSLSDEIVYRILTETCNNSEMARRVGTTRQTVQQIRTGKSYSNLFPEIPRNTGTGNMSCYKCYHRRKNVSEEDPNPCSFRFPEPLIVGVFYARECNLFQPSSAG